MRLQALSLLVVAVLLVPCVARAQEPSLADSILKLDRAAAVSAVQARPAEAKAAIEAMQKRFDDSIRSDRSRPEQRRVQFDSATLERGLQLVGIYAEATKDERQDLSVDQLEVVREAFVNIRAGRPLPLADVEQLIWGFIDSMSRTTRSILPLAKLREHDEYTFVHCVNVSLLVIGQARSFGIAGDWHGLPLRVRAPHRGLRCIGDLLCMGLIL
jgi:HD-GYP domain-containing protein (c-di-GMP phosphodiesterase class II)